MKLFESMDLSGMVLPLEQVVLFSDFQRQVVVGKFDRSDEAGNYSRRRREYDAGYPDAAGQSLPTVWAHGKSYTV